jgi:hypothetical protein
MLQTNIGLEKINYFNFDNQGKCIEGNLAANCELLKIN